MKLTKKQLKEIQEIEKKVANVCDANDGVVDEITGITYPKKTIEVALNDKGVIINKETGKPHRVAIDIDEMDKLVKEKESKKIAINLSFGTSSPSLKKQLENQGFKISDYFIERCEKVIDDLHSLKNIGILKDKELVKCFKRLKKEICIKVLYSELKDGERAILKKTIIKQ